jgi:hypothetical protein
MDNQSGVEIEVRDFAANNDVCPVSDPNIFSETQRLAQAQAVLQMATQAPQLFDLRAAYARVLRQLKVPNINEVLPDPQGIKESNPALENVAMSMGRHAAAFPDQDHMAHLQVHLAFAQDPNYGGSPLVGPQFTPLVLEHIKQHMTLHYLQSMRNYVSQAAGGEDTLKLHEERPLKQDDQKALALAAKMVGQDSQQTFAGIQPIVQQLVQKQQQAAQAQQQQVAANDPTAQVLLKTQMAETQRKQQEAQAKMQLQQQSDQQNYQIKVAELQQKVQELQAKYSTQSDIDSQRNATDIAMANINNAAKERVAMISAGAQMDQFQAQVEHDQNMSALEAIDASNADIRQHGLQIQQQQFQAQAQQVQAQAEAQQQAQQAAQQHAQQMMQQGQQAQNQGALQQQQHENTLEQQAAAAPTPQPPQGQ